MKATTIPLNEAVLLLFASAFSLSLGGCVTIPEKPEECLDEACDIKSLISPSLPSGQSLETYKKMTSISPKFVTEKRSIKPPEDKVRKTEKVGQPRCKNVDKRVLVKDKATKYRIKPGKIRKYDLNDVKLCERTPYDLCCKNGPENCGLKVFDVARGISLREDDKKIPVSLPKKWDTINVKECIQTTTTKKKTTRTWYPNGQYTYEKRIKDGDVKVEEIPQRIQLKSERVLILRECKPSGQGTKDKQSSSCPVLP
uniref:Lipoprotein n=1 Tax=Candidatus Kentrum sp. TC TaxID=2126339 RepID=A0A450YR17_9GAMM|nr:MAG: hypothetical protein BECKTC1821E_GA0114239_103015 [Candidatus Kentron sp. TC]